jgi:hypothetical protein
MRKLIWVMAVAGLVAAAPALQAQDKSAAETNMQILRDKLKADKKAVIAADMKLTDAESRVFWPTYDAYQKDLDALNQRLKAGITAYSDAWRKGPIGDAMAKQLLDEALAIDEAELKMRRTHAAKLLQDLPAAKATRYLQMESKIRALIRYELAAGIPLVD